jgi:hypothetical protein
MSKKTPPKQPKSKPKIPSTKRLLASKTVTNAALPRPTDAIEIAPGVSVTTAPLSDFQLDPHNLNDHTPRGHSMLTREIQEHGIGRPMFATADGIMAAGNLTKEVIHDVSGNPNVIVIRTDGKTPIIHQRTDLQSGDSVAVEMALADNYIAHTSFNLNPSAIAALDPKLCQRYLFAFEINNLIAAVQPDSGLNPAQEWTGMPEFVQEDKTAWKSIIVHFDSLDNMNDFAELVEQTLTEKTKSIWYPKKEREELLSLVAHEQS